MLIIDPPATAGGTDRIQVRLVTIEHADIAKTRIGKAISLEKLLPVIRGFDWFCGADAVGVLHVCRS